MNIMNNKYDMNNNVKATKKIDAGRKIEISNLAKEIQIEELLVLFAQFGEISKCNILWDNNKSKRVRALIEFENRKQAMNAQREYNGAELDKHVIYIKLI